MSTVTNRGTIAAGPVFFSYAGSDRDTAVAIVERLKAAGVDIWHDVEGIGWGENWVERLQNAMDGCAAYIILVGKGGVHRWVKAELGYALRRHFEEDLPILPLLTGGAGPEQLPPFLSIFQAESLPTDPDESFFARLAGRLREAALTTEKASRSKPSEVCPYPGLEAYDENTAGFFFGRQTETLDCLRLLGRTRDGVYRRWLHIDGPSGVGKSSLVRAGIIPAVRRGWIEEESAGQVREWLVAVMRPGTEPLKNLSVELARTLSAAPGREHLADTARDLRRTDGSDPAALAALLQEAMPEKGGFLTGCRVRRSGSTQRGRGARPSTGGGMRSGKTAPTAAAVGASGTANRRRRSGPSRRTRSRCTTPRAMCGSGCRTAGTVTTGMRPVTARHGRQAVEEIAAGAWYVAARGAADPSTSVRQTAAGSSPAYASTTSVFVWPRTCSPLRFVLWPFVVAGARSAPSARFLTSSGPGCPSSKQFGLVDAEPAVALSQTFRAHRDTASRIPSRSGRGCQGAVHA
jgi:hypothetical protein